MPNDKSRRERVFPSLFLIYRFAVFLSEAAMTSRPNKRCLLHNPYLP
jgi:hypothetical protein